MSTSSGGGLSDLLRHRDFTLLVAARFLATLAALAQSVAIGWLVYTITGDPFDLGLVGLFEFLPSLAFAFVAGPMVDRMDRRKLLAAAILVEAACAAALLLLATSGLDKPWPVFAAAAVLGAARAFVFPATSALLPNVVPAALFTNAVAFGSSTYQFAAIAGPAMGGLLYALGPQVVFGFSFVVLLAASVMAFAIRAQRNTPADREPPTIRTVLAGFAYVWRQPVVLGAISLDLFVVFFGGAVALMPVFAGEILNVGAFGVGLLRAAPAFGAAIMAIYLAWRPLGSPVGYWMFAAVGLFGLATVGFGYSRSFPLSLALLVLLGAADEISVVIRSTIIQLATPDDMRGRVSAVNGVFIGASNQLGEFRSGVTAAWWGTVNSVLIGGYASLAIAVAWMWLFPSLRRIRRFEDARLVPAHNGAGTPSKSG